MQRIYLKDRSFSTESLPSEVGLLVELLTLCNDNEATFEVFSSAIKRDSGLTAKFLQMANSPLYRQWKETTELKRMLIVLGLKNVKKIIITSAVQQFFSKLAQKTDKNVHQLWLRSLVCAHLAENLAKQLNYQKTEEAYLAGLLHQIGILLLLVNDEENYRIILQQYDTTDDFSALERMDYGIDHCEVGAALIESWQLDSLLSDAVLFQYADTDELTSAPLLLRIIAVARAVSSRLDSEAHEQDIERATALLRLPQDSTLECFAIALDDSRKVLSELGFAGNVSFAEAKEGADNEENRERKNTVFSEQIKNITLAYCFVNGETENSESFIKELRINFTLLFNLKQLIFLRYEAASGKLIPVNDLQLSRLDEIVFTETDQNSTVVNSFLKRKSFDSLHHRCSITDNQIIRMMGAECAYFLPVFHEKKNLGVLAIGVARKELATFNDQRPLIELLITEIGKKYFAVSLAEEPEDSISLTDFNKIVHEVKNPLTIINNYLYILGKKLDTDHSAREEIRFIKEEIERVTVILAKARSRDKAIDGTLQADVNKLLEELNNFFSSSLFDEKDIRCKLLPDAGIPPLCYPENKLKQVFINIIKNAVEALPQSGSIEISTRDNCFQNGNRFIEISIKDNGPGIANEVLKNLFRPVESTKKGHSGLGLSIVSDLISELSGTISCYSSQGVGTEFKILLPRLTIEQQTE
ncbi:MAG: HDOD domain-containing protein [Deltaproteobacteria bacterium]|nr:HDOD domain-containing protein [Deltaproteobacteria bacterium]